MSWIGDALLPLGAIARELAAICVELHRIADAQEGVTPFKEVPQAEEGPAQIADMVTHDDAYYAQVEQIETMLRKQHHRQPTPEEICAELDALPVLAEDAAEAIRVKMRRLGGEYH